RSQSRWTRERRLDGGKAVPPRPHRPWWNRLRGPSAGPIRRKPDPVLHGRHLRVRPGARPDLLGIRGIRALDLADGRGDRTEEDDPEGDPHRHDDRDRVLL